MSSKPITLYGFSYGDRSGRVRWLFEELGIAYEDHMLSWDLMEHRSPEYLKINPMGTVPTVRFDGRSLCETGAICLTFVDLHPQKGLAPQPGSPLRAEYYQWMFFATSTLEPLMEKLWRAREAKDHAAEAQASEEFKAAALLLESALSGKTYLVGNEFSAADIMIGSLLNWGDFLIKLSPVFKIYFEKLKARPACRKSRIFT